MAETEKLRSLRASPRRDLLGGVVVGVDVRQPGRSRDGDRLKARLPEAEGGFGWLRELSRRGNVYGIVEDDDVARYKKK